MHTTDPFGDWIAHFQRNLSRPWTLVEGEDDRLTPAEAGRIASSIQAFQIGESSDGAHFRRKALAWSEGGGEPAYAEAVRLFIAEENRHAEMLGAFMDRHGIPRVRHQWTDRIFRWARRLLGLELCTRILVAAELIATVYYRALRDATQSPALLELCTRILHDENFHIAFQTEAIASCQEGRGPLKRWAIRNLYRGFMGGVMAVVWWDHGRVLRAGGYTFLRFAAEVTCILEDALLMMDGHPDVVRVRREAELIDRLLVR